MSAATATPPQAPPTSFHNGDRLREQCGTWSVWRQDENGNRAVVATCLAKHDAEKMVTSYEAKGHKQYYWLEQEKKS